MNEDKGVLVTAVVVGDALLFKQHMNSTVIISVESDWSWDNAIGIDLDRPPLNKVVVQIEMVYPKKFGT